MVEEWLDTTSDNSAAYESNTGDFPPKWPNIPVLRDFSVDLGEEYWKHFPSKPMPRKAESSIDADKLEVMVEDRKHKMTNHEYTRAMKAVEFLRNGAPSHQKSSQGMFCKKCFKHGEIRPSDIGQYCYLD